ncbi:SDR family oxidoreductase [Mycobacterium sp. 050134]|uniref:SDR family oxidoreductase n=1 Tax=Mycobacterium sp. 050134 TaxID=3096111 RepID=UPI002ED79B09
MTRVGVIGATGRAGSRVVARLRARDVAVVQLCRAHGVDVVSGRGLSRALRGVDVVIDVSNPMPADRRSPIADVLAAASRNIVGACAAQDVQRLVVSTVAALDDPVLGGLPYCAAKLAAKRIALDGPVPTTIIKSTQWYESATTRAAVSYRDDEVTVQDWLIQPIAADTVADVLVEAALGQTHPPRTIAGPHPVRLPELTAKVLAWEGDGRRVRAAPPAVPALAAGALLPSEQAVVVGPDVDTWLGTRPPADTNGSDRPSRTGAPDCSKV